MIEHAINELRQLKLNDMAASLQTGTLIAALFLVAVALQVDCANAAVMTFDNPLLLSYATSYSEDGIHADGGGGRIGPFFLPGTAHMDDAASGYASVIRFTMDREFNAVSFDIFPTGFNYLVCTDGGAVCSAASYANIQVSGFSNGSLVAQSVFEMFGGRFTLDSAFQNIDSFVIGVRNPPFTGTLPDGSEAFCWDYPCSHFDIDNVTLAPVPLPSGGLLLVSALGGLVLMQRRKPREFGASQA